MDFPEFVADDFEKGLFVGAADVDGDFAFGVVFDDLSAGPFVGEDEAVFPNVILVFDEGVSFYDEAGEDAFGHEVVAVAEDEVVVEVPVVFGLADGEELGGDVVAFIVWQLVGEFEAHHELKEFVAQV